MPNPSLKRTAAVEKIANVEMLLAKLRQDFEAANYHRNAVVEDCLQKAKSDLSYALSDLLYDDFDSALRIADVVAIRISFAKQLLEADSVEHLLGESDYLELSDASLVPANADLMIKYYFFQLEHELTSVYSRLKQ
jgi:hypothetical protein